MNPPDSTAAPSGIGIALSGGGIRAACLGLGVLQAADRSGLLAGARYVSAVSGGSYTATAFLAARALPDPPAERAPLWAQGSLEEQHLRRRLRYLGEDWSDILIAVVQYVIGLVLNLLPFLATLYLLFATLGQIYVAVGVIDGAGGGLAAAMFPQRLAIATVVAVASAFIDRTLARRGISAGVRFATMSTVVVVMLPDLLAWTAVLLNQPAEMLVRLAALVLASCVLGAAVMRSQWVVQQSAARFVVVRLLRAVFTCLMVMVLLALATLALRWSLVIDPTLRWLLALACVTVLLTFGTFVHANATSLHQLYLRRLDRAFVVRAASQGDQTAGARHLSETTFGDVGSPDLPELLVCAAVNLTQRESAEGEGCGSFVFSPTSIGGPHVGQTPTVEYARTITDARLSCASVIAASGAAIAPNMGVFTRRSLRAAMSLTNLRLGLWLPNPGHPGSAATHQIDTLRGGWYEPGPLSSWREALGSLSSRHRFVFVSDGGHWDNSGVVELLRRRCQYIFLVDASVDAQRVANLLRLVSLARVETGVEFDTDGSLLDCTDPVVRIPFTYPTQDTDARNYLLVMRTHISPAMPPDLVALGNSTGPFPSHSTLNQFLRARDVDAYLALGRWLFREALDRADLPPAAYRVRSADGTEPEPTEHPPAPQRPAEQPRLPEQAAAQRR